MKTSVGKTSIEIARGDITEYEVDAIATATTGELSMGAGVAGALKRVGGEAIEAEAMLQGPIDDGEAVVTTGHDLKAQWVVHAAVMTAELTTDADLIARATHSTLAMADSAHARSLAMPAFGTGVGGFPLYQCASIMVAETVRYLKERGNSGLRRIVFVTYSDAARAAFINALVGIGRF
jgi:O-acetyl-ADP-ribose deacetylase (regulator of RNase III)